VLPARATETGLHSSRECWCFRDVGILGSDCFDMKFFNIVGCYLQLTKWNEIV